MDTFIKNPYRIAQPVDFIGLKYGNIIPTDIDALIEYKDVAYVIVELKHNGAPVPKGQRLAIERMVRDLSVCGKMAVAIIADHKVDDTSIPVIAAECVVREVFESQTKRWRHTSKTLDVAEIMELTFKAADAYFGTTH